MAGDYDLDGYGLGFTAPARPRSGVAQTLKNGLELYRIRRAERRPRKGKKT